MKIKLIILLSFVFLQSTAQKQWPIIQSNSSNVKIVENNLLVTSWNLDPSLKPDIYVTGKISKSQNLKLVTDIDSLEINLKPNESFDFIVLKNKQDSCFTRFQSYKIQDFSSLKPELSEKIIFNLTSHNNIKVQTIINNKDTLNLHFDTGASDFFLTRNTIIKYLKPKSENFTMNDISDNTFAIGNLKWEHQQVYPNEITAHENDGLFGWNLFDGKILQVNYDTNEMYVSSKLPKIDKDYEKFDIENLRDQFRINIEFEVNGKSYVGDFLFDTGFQKAAMLDQDILQQNMLPVDQLEVLKTTVLRNSRNQEIPLKTVKIDKFKFGKYSVTNVPSELNNYNKPTGYATHFLGSDIIKRFNLIFDFQNNVVYLKPNKSFNVKYFDEIHN